eukprot:GHVS01015918.1.p1 GENE.GHVS01015918.1~~GHVS01015918.1.p1  ORF type:complete len:112 (-),score=10.27 GHVS01015918.1:98-433(-)
MNIREFTPNTQLDAHTEGKDDVYIINRDESKHKLSPDQLTSVRRAALNTDNTRCPPPPGLWSYVTGNSIIVALFIAGAVLGSVVFLLAVGFLRLTMRKTKDGRKFVAATSP